MNSLLAILRFKKISWFQIIPFAVITILAGLNLTNLEMSHNFRDESKTGATPIQNLEALEEMFPTASADIIAVQASDPYNSSVIKALDDLSKDLLAIEGMDEVISLTTMQDLQFSGEEMIQVPFVEWPWTSESRLRVEKILSQNRFYKKLLQIPDQSGWTIVIKQQDMDLERQELIDQVIDQYSGSFDQIAISSLGYLNLENKKLSSKDLNLLTMLALLIIFIIHLIFTRKLKDAVILWSTSGIAALLTLTLYPLTGKTFGNVDILIPILVMTITTTYSIHMYRSTRNAQNDRILINIRKILPTIVLTALTTLIGFASLIFSPLEHLKGFGLYTSLGIIIAVVISLYYLPPFLTKIKSHSVKSTFNLRIPEKSRWPLLIILPFFIALPGLLTVRNDYRLNTFFPPNHEVHQFWALFNTAFNGSEPLDIYIRTPEPYALVDPVNYNRLNAFLQDIENEFHSGMILSYMDTVNWMHGKLSNHDGELTPREDWEIAETLEILTSMDTDATIDQMISPEWDITKITLLIGFPDNSYDSYVQILKTVERELPLIFERHFPDDYKMILGGEMIKWEVRSRQLTRSLIFSIMLFFPIVFVILTLILKSARWAVLPLIAPLLTILFFFGLAGLTGIPITTISSFSFAMILGISIDDSIFFCITLKRKQKDGSGLLKRSIQETMAETGKSIFQTTVIICSALVPLFFSNYITIRQTSFLMMFSFLLSMGLTLFFIPAITPKFVGGKQHEYAVQSAKKDDAG